MKEKQIENILKLWEEKNANKNNTNYSTNQLTEIAVNCASLAETWLTRINKGENVSLELFFYDKNGTIVETLHGVDKNNLPFVIFETLVSKSNMYSKVTLNKFKYNNNEKITEEIGNLEIS